MGVKDPILREVVFPGTGYCVVYSGVAGALFNLESCYQHLFLRLEYTNKLQSNNQTRVVDDDNLTNPAKIIRSSLLVCLGGMSPRHIMPQCRLHAPPPRAAPFYST